MSEQNHNHNHDNQDHEHNNEHNDEHNHGFGNEKIELYFAIGSGVFWLTGLILSFMATIPAWLPLSLFIIAFFLGGFFTLIEAYEAVKSGKFEIDFLMLVAAAGAVALGKWEEGAY